jgi:anthranilate phosphoribosyltransferase
MRELAAGVDIGDLANAVDIVGTGGDASGTFNVSTASMFVAAAAGCHVAKHGNRSVSSKSGSADVLEAAGVRLDLTPEQVARCVREVGVGFMFAPAHHGAMKHAIGPRRELGVRTLFNVLGPLTNPAGVPASCSACSSMRCWSRWRRSCKASAPSTCWWCTPRRARRDQHRRADDVAELATARSAATTIEPEDFGLPRRRWTRSASMAPSRASSCCARPRRRRAGAGPRHRAAERRRGHLRAGLADARSAIDGGAARERLERLAAISNQVGG